MHFHIRYKELTSWRRKLMLLTKQTWFIIVTILAALLPPPLHTQHRERMLCFGLKRRKASNKTGLKTRHEYQPNYQQVKQDASYFDREGGIGISSSKKYI
mmetsp:Transcript_1737/g.2638  ORF Transcript_1737/g.2638 Transcript_1737/m.2638 type:complete len:100 (+) Transcript_1737:915-1214(+)